MQTNADWILANAVSGFHQYILETPPRLCQVSQSLCRMLGLSQQELLCPQTDGYARQIHPEDRQRYEAFLARLARQPQTLTEVYRLICQDGQVLPVQDTAVSALDPEGHLVAASVLTRLPHLPGEDMQLLNETIPCGMVRYTCQQPPRITYMNRQMEQILQIPQRPAADPAELELYRENLFLLIPMDQRQRFSRCLEQVLHQQTPVAGEMSLIRWDGSRAYVFGWVSKVTGKDGQMEFQSVCMDITHSYQSRKRQENRQYLKALADVYDKIFAFDLAAGTVECLYCGKNSSFQGFQGIPMQMEEAVERWIMSAVVPEDQEPVARFFRSFAQKQLYSPEGQSPRICYRVHSSNGNLRHFTGIFLKLEDNTSFYCCREAPAQDEVAALKDENHQLKEGVRDLMMRFFSGIAAFEVTAQGMVKPLYASDNVCRFFGCTRQDWMALTQCYTPVKTFVAGSQTSWEDFAALLEQGEGEFTYLDLETQQPRRIKAICSQRSQSATASRYVMLYHLDAPQELPSPEEQKVVIRTFGYFDVFVAGKPIAFRNKKSKELLALLVDRKGGYITSEEAIAFLWEDEPANAMTLARYRKAALRLKNTLEEYGISQIVEVVDGKRRIVMEEVSCDLYQYLSGQEEYAQLFKGSYLTNYSWAETTLGELTNS